MQSIVVSHTHLGVTRGTEEGEGGGGKRQKHRENTQRQGLEWFTSGEDKMTNPMGNGTMRRLYKRLTNGALSVFLVAQVLISVFAREMVQSSCVMCMVCLSVTYYIVGLTD